MWLSVLFIALLMILPMVRGWAQEREKEETMEEILSKVTIDTIQIKATPYDKVLVNGVWKDEDKQIDYYNDITIYEINKKEAGYKIAGDTLPKPAIFMLPGGGFFGISDSDSIGMGYSNSPNISLGSKLSNSLDAKVYLIIYETNPDSTIQNSVFVKTGTDSQNCNHVRNETGKARALEASYKAFRDLRKILKVNYMDSVSQKNIDPNNFYMIGSSAGAVLIMSSLFLDSTEIPASITYKHVNCTNATASLSIPIGVRTDYWPIPFIKGVVTMAGAWIYDSLQLVNTPPANTLNTAIFMMHGTCDELINRRTGRIGYKRIGYSINSNPENRFIKGYGTEVIFNLYKNIHNKLAYAQVLEGGHGVFNLLGLPAWDHADLNLNLVTDTIYNKVYLFIYNLISDSSRWESRAFTMKPTKKSGNCNTTFDVPFDTICFQKIYNPNPTYITHLCDNNNRTAVVQYIHPDAVYTWSVNSGANISIQGPASGTTIQYKRIANINKSDTLILTITRPCAETRTFKYAVQSVTPPNLTLSPSGWNTICSGNKTATLQGVPVGTPPPDWTATPNIQIVSFSGNSVTYKRINNISSTGILTATITINGCTIPYSFTVNTLPTLGNWVNTFGIVSQCDFGIVTNSPSKVPNGTNATFSTIYPNAVQNGVTNLEWTTNCTYVAKTQTWIGNDLREDYTVTAIPGCTYVQVRPQNMCGFGATKSTGISVEPCGGGGWGMMVAPNPANSYLEVSLTNEDLKKLQQTYTLQVIDAMGNTIIKTSIAEGKKQLNISDLKEGVYKAIIQTEDELLYRTFHVAR